MSGKAIIVIISLSLIIIGIIILALREKIKGRLVQRDDVGYSSESNPEIAEKIKDIIVMNPKDYPDLLRVNGGIIGMKMAGGFARKEAPAGAYASYNCFHILFCPVFPLGCYLIHDSMKGISCYGELKTEKDELLYVLTKGWGIFLIIAGALVMLIGLNA